MNPFESAEFDVPPGQRKVGLRLVSDGAPALVTLTDPLGRTIKDVPRGLTRTPEATIAHISATETHIILERPAGGKWKLAVQPGSAPLVQLRRALPRPADQVKTKIHRAKDGSRTLDVNVGTLSGDEVQFVEEGADVSRQIGVVKPGITRRLRIPGGRTYGGKRRIRAHILDDGLERSRRVIGTYHVKASPRLATPRVRVRRRGAGDSMTVRWRRVSGAKHYVVTAKMQSRRTARRLVRGTSVVLRDIGRFRRAKVTVVAVESSGRESRAGRTTSARTAKPKALTRRLKL